MFRLICLKKYSLLIPDVKYLDLLNLKKISNCIDLSK